jgi:hypothetical protein
LTTHTSYDTTRSDLVEFNTHSFVIKIWLEVTPAETRRYSWRGHITHIPSGERRYVANLFCILTFIMGYLKSIGIKFGRFWWVKDWLTSRKFSLNEEEVESGFVRTSSHRQQIKPQ